MQPQPDSHTPPDRPRVNLAGWLGAKMFRGLQMACRIEVVNPHTEKKYLQSHAPALLVTWHCHALGALTYLGRFHPAVMASRSRDGEFLASFQRHLGCLPIRGSSSRGGVSAHRAMVRFMGQGGKLAANVADGPQGPRFKAKAGMIALAQLTRAPLIPGVWSGDRLWVLKKTWDQTMIPKPLCRVKILYGEPILVPRRLNSGEREIYRQRLEDELNRIRLECDSLARRPDSE